MTHPVKNNIVFGHFFVAFVDLLGQRARLKKLDALPKNRDKDSTEYKEFIKNIKETIGAVDDLQTSCKDYFKAFTKDEANDPYNVIPALKRLSKTEIKFQHFSDGLVIYAPLRTDAGYSPVKGVYGALAACGSLCLLALAKKRPIRIGAAISVAAELRDNELYGKAVVDAYELESEVAQYPRVVLANEVADYLTAYATQECGKDIARKIEAKTAQACLSMLARDFDGYLIVDYLGQFFQEKIMGSPTKEIANLLQLAYAYIDDQVKQNQISQNSKLALRYSILHGYFYEHLGARSE